MEWSIDQKKLSASDISVLLVKSCSYNIICLYSVLKNLSKLYKSYTTSNYEQTTRIQNINWNIANLHDLRSIFERLT